MEKKSPQNKSLLHTYTLYTGQACTCSTHFTLTKISVLLLSNIEKCDSRKYLLKA